MALQNTLLAISSPCLTHSYQWRSFLRDATSHLEVHVLPDEGFSCDISPKVCFQIRQTVFSAIDQVFNSMQLEGIETAPAFMCPCSKKEPHFASLHTSIDTKQFLRCSNTKKNAGPVEEKHQLWLDTPDTENNKPSLPKLLQFKVHEKVGDRYAEFGLLLLNDEDGCYLAELENDCQGKCRRILLKIFTAWVRGKGKPLTWDALIETLQSCDLNELADHIQENTQ